MAFTFEEIQQGVSENPELKTQFFTAFENDASEYLKGKGFELLTADQKSQLLKKHEDEKIRPRLSEFATRIEQDIFEKTGIAKAHDEEKYYDYLKRAIDETKAANTGDEASKQLIASLKTELETAKGAVSNKDQEFAKERMQWKVTGELSSAFADLKIAVPPGVDEKAAADYTANKRAMLQNELLRNYDVVEENGKLVFKGKDGQFAMTGGNFATAKELLEQNFKYDFETAQQRGGTGTQGSHQRNSKLTGITDKDGLYEAASKEGLIAGSTAWLEWTKETAKTLNITL